MSAQERGLDTTIPREALDGLSVEDCWTVQATHEALCHLARENHEAFTRLTRQIITAALAQLDKDWAAIGQALECNGADLFKQQTAWAIKVHKDKAPQLWRLRWPELDHEGHDRGGA